MTLARMARLGHNLPLAHRAWPNRGRGGPVLGMSPAPLGTGGWPAGGSVESGWIIEKCVGVVLFLLCGGF